MKLTFLGTGTSHGVPVIGCKCPVCQSQAPLNYRTRSSIYIETEESALLIDTATDFRQQAIREGLDRLDGVLFTHAHADHIHGLDDVRIFTRGKEIPIYASEDTIIEIRERFSYIFEKSVQHAGGKPKLSTHPLRPGVPTLICGISVTPIPIYHGKLPIFGYRIGTTAYLTDCSAVPDTSFPLLEGIKILILGTLRYSPHPTHFHLDASLSLIKKLNPWKAYLTHLSHDFDHEKLLKELPPGVEPAWDGLSFQP